MPQFIPYHPLAFSAGDQAARAREFYELCSRRRTVREYSSRPIVRELLETLIRTAGTAPSGANKQPWRFVIVTDPAIKHEIRLAVEKEERESYEHRMPQEWLDDLAALGTDWHKEFLEIAPALIVVFSIEYEKEGEITRKNYYVKESVGIAVGFLLAAIHNAGLVSLTHTPSPMNFLQKILDRPANERPFLLIPVGYAAENVVVPDIKRKSLEDIALWK
ncbi:MAG: nitroreductase family protein, partial [Ignavibacteriae bacterium]|nr:nitroreductase family protein [Ignavibacteria bacterium]MBI3364591.1 nitroreductase family protein [Ignavibacteriota bacterium]